VTATKSCSITTLPALPRWARYLLYCECVAGCGLRTYVMIKLGKDGTVSLLCGSTYNRLHWSLFNPAWVPTEGEKVLISCDYCGRASVVCRFSKSADGTSFTLENLSNVTKDTTLSCSCDTPPAVV